MRDWNDEHCSKCSQLFEDCICKGEGSGPFQEPIKNGPNRAEVFMFYIFNARSKSLLDTKNRKTFEEAAEDASQFVEERILLGAEANEYPLQILEAVARVGEEPTPVKVTKIKKS